MSKEDLAKEWSYDFPHWVPKMLSYPVKLLVQHDRSESHEMNIRHAFLLEDGNIAVVKEEGCSCYTSLDAEIKVHCDLESAKKDFLSDWNVPSRWQWKEVKK